MDVKEGFLCPMCLQDLRSFHNLQSHFEAAHSNEDKALVTQIKGIFSKAKDIILRKDEDDEENYSKNPFSTSPSSASARNNFDPSLWEPQEIGITTCHTDKFKAMRDARLDRVVIETNKIVIRLEKLLRLDEADPSKRKAFEQGLVPWVDDRDVPFCPTCGDKFNLARRRHHCRLCGAIICTKCSIFLPYQIAAELVHSIRMAARNSPKKQSRRRSTLTEQECDKIFVRICVECDKVLERNKEKLDRRHNSDLMVMLYKKMQIAMNDAIKLQPEFAKIAESLNNGEEYFKLDVANEKRFQLMQMFEAIDVISKKIAVLNTEDEENPPSNGSLRLQAAIRREAYSFLQDNMLSLPSLPSQPKLQVLQTQRRAENERRLRKQREEARRQREEEKRRQEIEKLERERELIERSRRMEQGVKFSGSTSESSGQDRPSVLMLKDTGWSADTISIASNTSRHTQAQNYSSDEEREPGECRGQDSSLDRLEPLLEQIQYVRESAKQARAAGMIAEAESLEKNAEELKAEYRKQQTAMAFAVTPTLPNGPQQFAAHVDDVPRYSYKSSATTNDTGEDPLFQQICYISKCVEEAKSARKYDEARILSENLDELKKLYNGSQY